MQQPSTDELPLRIVVAGGIGSGKSSVAARLGELGATVIEADAVGHEVLEPGGPVYRAVAERWPEVVGEIGEIDRAALAEIVFSDGEQLRELEAMTHPAIAEEIAHRVEAAGNSPVVLEIPVALTLIGPGWIRVVVESAEEIRVSRAVARGGDEEDIRRRIAAQVPAEEWQQTADYLIVNDGTLGDLINAVDELWERLVQAFARRRDEAASTPGGSPPDSPS